MVDIAAPRETVVAYAQKGRWFLVRNEFALGNEQGFCHRQKPRLSGGNEEVDRLSGWSWVDYGVDTNVGDGDGCGYVGDVQTCRVHPDRLGEASSKWVDENLQGRVRNGNNNATTVMMVMMMMLMVVVVVPRTIRTSFTSNSRMQ